MGAAVQAHPRQDQPQTDRKRAVANLRYVHPSALSSKVRQSLVAKGCHRKSSRSYLPLSYVACAGAKSLPAVLLRPPSCLSWITEGSCRAMGGQGGEHG